MVNRQNLKVNLVWSNKSFYPILKKNSSLNCININYQKVDLHYFFGIIK